MKKYRVVSIKSRIFGYELLDKLDIIWVDKFRVIAKPKDYGFITEYANDCNHIVIIEEY